MDNIDSQSNSTKGTRLRTLVLVMVLTGAGLALSACNTVEGVGRDVEAAGDAVADTADDAKD